MSELYACQLCVLGQVTNFSELAAPPLGSDDSCEASRSPGALSEIVGVVSLVNNIGLDHVKLMISNCF